MLKPLPLLQKDEKYFLHNVDSLFKKIPLKEAIDYIIYKIYNKKLLNPICEKLMFRRMLYKLTRNCTTLFNEIFNKQIITAQLAVVLWGILADVHIARTDNEVVKPIKFPFYEQFVDNIYCKRHMFQKNMLFQALNDFHSLAFI